MMSLLNSLKSSSLCSRRLNFSCFHTTTSPWAQARVKRKTSTPTNAPSRTRLVKDLKPRPASPHRAGRLEVAPDDSKSADVRRSGDRKAASKKVGQYTQREPFKREPVPHADASVVHNKGWDSTPRRRSTRSEVDHQNSDTSNQVRHTRRPSSSSSIPDRKAKIVNPLGSEFDISAKTENPSRLPKSFSSPPLMEGLLASLKDVLGHDAQPTSIQALSLKHLFGPPEPNSGPWHQFLLASETGSGKSIAYLLPVLQSLKQSEGQQPNHNSTRYAINPRGLVLAPTHELSRQLSGFAKDLLHNVKLRVMCTSRANTPSSPRASRTASKMAADFSGTGKEGEFDVRVNTKQRPVDLLVGTPMKVLEMAKGRGWDREEDNVEDNREMDKNGQRAQKLDKDSRRGQPELGLAGIEWVVVDEADVLFDPDFQESTRMLLADIATAKGHPVPFDASSTPLSPQKPTPPHITTPGLALTYPFHLLLTTATIPSSLASYLDNYHPTLTRLASPNLHHLPRTLQTEYVNWTGGNRNADVERRLQRVWAEDAIKGGGKSKVLVFCNRSSKVEDLGKYLTEKSIPNVALTSSSETRRRGSNHHLDGFLKNRGSSAAPSSQGEEPHVMITTSLLSRGLDFSPSIRHVFIMDEPRNMIDFLHRAGRSGRAGERGKVVIFGKMSGRGSNSAKEVRKKVGALAA